MTNVPAPHKVPSFLHVLSMLWNRTQWCSQSAAATTPARESAGVLASNTPASPRSTGKAILIPLSQNNGASTFVEIGGQGAVDTIRRGRGLPYGQANCDMEIGGNGP